MPNLCVKLLHPPLPVDENKNFARSVVENLSHLSFEIDANAMKQQQ